MQTQINFIVYIELHILTYLRSSSGSQLVFKHIKVLKTNSVPEGDVR
jgi:hypothetical protein